jgi:hypothetical protein
VVGFRLNQLRRSVVLRLQEFLIVSLQVRAPHHTLIKRYLPSEVSKQDHKTKEEKVVRKHSRTTKDKAMRFRRLSLTTLVVALCIVAVAAITVISRQNASVKEASELETKSPVANNPGRNFVKVKVAGQEVEVDSQTGQLRELTPEEAQKLAKGLHQMVNKSSDGLEEVKSADGSESVDLAGRFQHVTVAKEDENGNLVQSCVDTPGAAGKFFGIDPKLIRNPNQDPKNPTEVTPGTTDQN